MVMIVCCLNERRGYLCTASYDLIVTVGIVVDGTHPITGKHYRQMRVGLADRW